MVLVLSSVIHYELIVFVVVVGFKVTVPTGLCMVVLGEA